MNDCEFCVLSYYKIFRVCDVRTEINKHTQVMNDLDARCRIYVSVNGINVQLSIHNSHLERYMQWIDDQYGLEDTFVKKDCWSCHVFPRITIKNKKELVALDVPISVDMEAAVSVSPSVWREMLNDKDNKILLDVRNSYEWRVGHFDGFEDPKVNSFRGFISLINDLKENHSIDKEVMMCCTGGIRCEILSRIMLRDGFKKIYQLDGGIVHYGQQEGNAHWTGKLFVFDDRLCVNISENEPEIISSCCFCQENAFIYYNCANMDCNELFISCRECQKINQGCCKRDCQFSKRRRSYMDSEPHRPFKRKSFYVQQEHAGGRT